jgi:hypothetical protein
MTSWSFSGDTLFFMGPIPPGSRVIAFQFHLMDGKIPFRLSLPMRASDFRLMSGPQVKLSRINLKYAGDMEVGGGKFSIYEGQGISEVNFVVVPAGKRGSLSLVIVVVVTLVVVAVALLFLKRRAKPVED